MAIEDIIAARAAGDLHQLSQHLLAMLDGLSPDDLSQLSKALLKGESAQTEKRREKADLHLNEKRFEDICINQPVMPDILQRLHEPAINRLSEIEANAAL